MARISKVTFVAGALMASIASATPANKANLAKQFGRFLPKSLNACTTCHLPSDNKNPQSLDEFPHNPFGHRLRMLGKELAEGNRPRDIRTRLMLIANEDADGDGVDNLTEILLGNGPGDKADRPTAQELEGGGKLEEAFAEFLKSYRWEPFDPVVRPAAPEIGDKTWARNPIDQFVAGGMAG